MNTLDFLRLILPADGLKAAFLKNDKRHLFTNSLEELADMILWQDRHGVTVYHACGVFAQGSVNRWQSNALGAKSLWIDLDVGDDPKKYPTAKDAAYAVGAFAARIGIPTPLMILSGGGIHAYWPLEELLPKGEWHRYATGLKALAEEHGLKADPSRTADIASILRPVGTFNRKSGEPVEVRAVYEAGPFKIAELAVLADNGKAERVRLPKVDPLTASLMKVQHYTPVHADDMAAGCAVIADLRDKRGAVSEPVWHALVGALAFAEDGEEAALEWASGGYEGEIAEKFERARALTGPTSCEAIQAVAGTKMCQGCPLFEKGLNPTMARPAPVNRAPAPQAAPPEHSDGEDGEEEPEQDWPIPQGFRHDGTSLIMEVPERNGGFTDALVCEHAVILTGTARAEIAEDKYSYVFHRFDPNLNRYREFTVPAKTIMSSAGLAEIAGRGGSIQHPDKFMQYIRAAVPLVQSSNNEMIKYEQFGWKGDDFLLGNRLYCQGGAVEAAVGSQDIENKSHLLRPRGGSLAAWTRAANRLFVAGSEAQSLCLLASFAAPLMKFQSADEGGAVLSLIGKSGTGKSTTLAAASSVWGRDKGVTVKNDDTYNSKFITLGVLCNLPVIYDEVHQTDPELIKRLIVTFTNGSDRARGTTDGSLVARSNSWQTLMLTGSNPSMVELIGSLPGSDAAGKRILELVVRMPEGTDHKTGDELKRQFEANAGWAGEAFIKALMEPGMLVYVREALAKYTKEIWQETGLKSEYRFWVRTMGAIAVAALLVNKLGLIEFSPQRIISWALEELKGQAIEEAGVSTRAAEFVSMFLNESLPDTLVIQREWKPRQNDNAILKTPTRQLTVRYEIENKAIIIDERRLKSWFITRGGGNYREAKEDLWSLGIMRRGTFLRSLGAGTMMPTGQIPVVVLDATREEFSGFTMEAAKTQESNVVPLRSR